MAKRKTTQRKTTKAYNSEQMRQWAHWFVMAACGLSVALNAYAGFTGIDGFQCLIAAVVNGFIPALALVLGKSAGYAYLSGRKTLAKIGAILGTILLLLSIAHCSHALHLLTGSGMVACTALALVIDAGMLYTEFLTIAK